MSQQRPQQAASAGASTASSSTASTPGSSAAPRSTPAEILPSSIPAIAALKSDRNKAQWRGPHHHCPVSDNQYRPGRNCCPEWQPPECPAFCLSDCNGLVGINDKHHFGHTAHFLDAAQRTLELFALARQVQNFFFGQPPAPSPSSMVSNSRKRLIEFEIVCQLVSVPPSQREFMKIARIVKHGATPAQPPAAWCRQKARARHRRPHRVQRPAPDAAAEPSATRSIT